MSPSLVGKLSYLRKEIHQEKCVGNVIRVITEDDNDDDDDDCNNNHIDNGNDTKSDGNNSKTIFSSSLLVKMLILLKIEMTVMITNIMMKMAMLIMKK